MHRLEIVDYLRSYAGGALELIAHKRADEAADEITRLRAELTAAQTVASEHETDAIEVDEERFVAWAERDRAVAERDALREENARLLKALKPFAMAAHSDIGSNLNLLHAICSLTLDDFRRARVAIREGGQDENKKD